MFNHNSFHAKQFERKSAISDLFNENPFTCLDEVDLDDLQETFLTGSRKKKTRSRNNECKKDNLLQQLFHCT